MPYLPVDLDAKKKWPMVARGLGVDVGFVAIGFCDMWEMAWSIKSDLTSILHLECMFRAPGERVAAILESFGFLARLEDGQYRIRGAAKFLGIHAAMSEGGKKSRGNLVQFRPKKSPARPAEGPEGGPEPSRPNPPALTPNTQHPTPKKKKSTAGSPSDEPAAPGWQELVVGLFLKFKELRGHDPAPRPKDWKSLKDLRLRAPDSEILARWPIGLRESFKGRCDTFWDLNEKFDSLTVRAQSPPAQRDWVRGRVGAEEADKSKLAAGDQTHEF